MKHLLLLPLLLGLTSPVQARVDPEVHKLCKGAKDYLGCVKAQSGESRSNSINPLQTIGAIGNRCPVRHAYAGGGQCGEVVKKSFGLALIASPANAIALQEGQKAIDAIGIWRAGLSEKPRNRRFYGLGKLTTAVFDPQCPAKEPALYTKSSCDEQPKAPTLSEIGYFFKPLTQKKPLKYWNEELEKLYGVKNLATDAKNYGSSKNRKPAPCLSGKPRPYPIVAAI